MTNQWSIEDRNGKSLTLLSILWQTPPIIGRNQKDAIFSGCKIYIVYANQLFSSWFASSSINISFKFNLKSFPRACFQIALVVLSPYGTPSDKVEGFLPTNILLINGPNLAVVYPYIVLRNPYSGVGADETGPPTRWCRAYLLGAPRQRKYAGRR